jgi:hypothetical protein
MDRVSWDWILNGLDEALDFYAGTPWPLRPLLLIIEAAATRAVMILSAPHRRPPR